MRVALAWSTRPLPFLAADSVQITQLFQNLIGNAIKYRRAEDPVVKVSARRDADEWVFAIEDNGQGFDQQYAERIFGLFQRLHGRDVEGTGMGLAISRKIVERHGGRMWAESRLGVGLHVLLLPAHQPRTGPVSDPLNHLETGRQRRPGGLLRRPSTGLAPPAHFFETRRLALHLGMCKYS